MVMIKYGLTPGTGRNIEPKNALLSSSYQEFQ